MIVIYIVVLVIYMLLFITSKGIVKTIHYEEALFFSLLLLVEYLFYDKMLLDILLWIVSMLLVLCLTYIKNRLTKETDSVEGYFKKAYLSRKNVYSKFDNIMSWLFILICYNLINKLGKDSFIVGCIPIAYFLLERGHMCFLYCKLKHFR